MNLTDKQGSLLLQLARDTIGGRLGLTDRPLHQQCTEAPYNQPGATFVTLKINGQLRGCIGNLEPSGTLVESIIANAEGAAFHDHRFPPLTSEEFGRVAMEISILSPASRITYQDGDDLIRQLRPGIDGVILELGARRATFLPQVWEQLPNPEHFLDHLCLKAGLPNSTWRRGKPEIYVYQVQSFSEQRQLC